MELADKEGTPAVLYHSKNQVAGICTPQTDLSLAIRLS